jgi:hypothetical protein
MRSTINKLMRILADEGIPITNPKPGVRRYFTTRKWQVVIKVNGRTKHIGYFDDLCDAIEARNAAEDKYFPNGRTPKRPSKTQPEVQPVAVTESVSDEDDTEDYSLEAEFYD